MALQLTVHDLLLAAPAQGDQVLHHAAAFTAWDNTFDAVRDTVNFGIHQLNHFGAGLRPLPGESLEQLLVQPLSGDPARIRQNAEACRSLADALAGWSSNLGALALRVNPVWDGVAGAAYLHKLGKYSLAARGAGALIRHGAVVLDDLALFSERVAVRVEELWVRLVHALERLAARVAAKLAGVAGLVSTVLDVATHGVGVVTEIIDDIELVISLIDQIKGLFTEVRTFVDDVERRLASLGELRDLARGLS